MKRFTSKSRFIFVLAVLVGFSLSPAAAHAGLLEFFFPSLAKKEPNLHETLRAPFADISDEDEDGNPKLVIPENQTPLEKPHRPSPQIGEFVSDFISNAMTFKKDYRKELDEILTGFDPQGAEQYKTFLQEKNILKILESGQYRIQSFTMGLPLRLNEGSVDGRYHWLFQAPVMVSYLPYGMDDYKGAQPTNQKILVKVQVGRYNDAPNRAGLLVERWEGTVQKLDDPLKKE